MYGLSLTPGQLEFSCLHSGEISRSRILVPWFRKHCTAVHKQTFLDEGVILQYRKARPSLSNHLPCIRASDILKWKQNVGAQSQHGSTANLCTVILPMCHDLLCKLIVQIIVYVQINQEAASSDIWLETWVWTWLKEGCEDRSPPTEASWPELELVLRKFTSSLPCDSSASPPSSRGECKCVKHAYIPVFATHVTRAPNCPGKCKRQVKPAL